MATKLNDGLYVTNSPIDSRGMREHLSDISNIANAYVGMLVYIQETDKYYKVTAISSLKKPTAYEEAIPTLPATYRPAGSKAASALNGTLLISSNEGNVYNINSVLTINRDNKSLFTSGTEEGDYPIGTNVVVINEGTSQSPSYKYDVLAGFVDMSGKADKSEMSVTDGTGADSDKVTIQLKSGTSATVLKEHQKIKNPSAGKFVNMDASGNLKNSGVDEFSFATAAQGAKADTAVQQVTVGTTTTGNAGTNASVVNSGTSTAPVFDFTIPRGADGADAVNPFKGWWPDLATLKAAITAIPGDYAYIIPAVSTDPVAIYEYDSTATSDNYWSDSGRTFNPANNQEFASGEELNEVSIIKNLTTGGQTNVLNAEGGKILAYNLQLLIESLANLAFNRNPTTIPFIDMGVDTGELKYNVTTELIGCTIDNAAPVVIGTPYSAVITPNSGYELVTPTITMGGVDITNTVYTGNGNIYIESVTNNITITCQCVKDESGGFKVTYCYNNLSQSPNCAFGQNGDSWAISQKLNVVSGHTLTICAGNQRNMGYGILFFDKTTHQIIGDILAVNATTRDVQSPNQECYARFAFEQSGVSDYGDNMYVLDKDTNTYLLKGSEIDLTGYGDWDDYKLTSECPNVTFEDEDGNHPNCRLYPNFILGLLSSGYSTKEPFIYVPIAGFTNPLTMLSRAVQYTTGTTIEYSVGFTPSDNTEGRNYGILIVKTDGTVDAHSQGTNALNTIAYNNAKLNNAKEVYLFLKTQFLSTAYIKFITDDNPNGTIVWDGSQYVQ